MIPSFVILTAGAALVGLIGFLIVHRVIKPINLEEHQSFLDAMLNIVGTLVSILLGLLVAAALDHYQNLEHTIDNEAANVIQLCRLSSGLPKEACSNIRALAVQYCNEVIDDEWPAMAKGEGSLKVTFTNIRLVNEIVRFKPSNDAETNLHASMLASMQTISDARRERLLVLNSNWAKHLMPMLFMCSFIVLVFAFLYARKGAVLHAILICLVALALGGNLGLVFVLSNPFSSDWKIEPRGFEMDRELLRQVRSNPELHKLIERPEDQKTASTGRAELFPGLAPGPGAPEATKVLPGAPASYPGANDEKFPAIPVDDPPAPPPGPPGRPPFAGSLPDPTAVPLPGGRLRALQELRQNKGLPPQR